MLGASGVPGVRGGGERGPSPRVCVRRKHRASKLRGSGSFGPGQLGEVDVGLNIFYREAGPSSAPKILLLHGFPSSSRMWEPLPTRLGDAFHLVAPDYPGSGHSDTPDPAVFAYTFDHLTEVIDGFSATLGLRRYVLFLQDYGGPIGFRLALAHPERVQALIVQNAVAHEDGLGLPEARAGDRVRQLIQRLNELGSA